MDEEAAANEAQVPVTSTRSPSRGGVRIRGVGRFARVATIAFAVPIDVAFVATLLSLNPLGVGQATVGGAMASALTLAAVRSLRIGVWLFPDQLVARTWWRTIRVAREELSSCITVSYWGAFTEGWSVSYLRELEIGTTEHQIYTLDGSIAFAGAASRHRSKILDYMAGPEGLQAKKQRQPQDARHRRTGSAGA